MRKLTINIALLFILACSFLLSACSPTKPITTPSKPAANTKPADSKLFPDDNPPKKIILKNLSKGETGHSLKSDHSFSTLVSHFTFDNKADKSENRVAGFYHTIFNCFFDKPKKLSGDNFYLREYNFGRFVMESHLDGSNHQCVYRKEVVHASRQRLYQGVMRLGNYIVHFSIPHEPLGIWQGYEKGNGNVYWLICKNSSDDKSAPKYIAYMQNKTKLGTINGINIPEFLYANFGGPGVWYKFDKSKPEAKPEAEKPAENAK